MERLTLDGQDFEYEIFGEGTPVLAVRNVAAPAGSWPTRGDIAALGRCGHALVSYRHLGTTDTIEGIARDTALLLDHLALGPVALWGWSQGAMTAQELALARPDLVRCAVLMATRGRLSAYDRVRYAIEASDVPLDAATLHAIIQNHPADSLCDDERFEQLWTGFREAMGPSPLGERAGRAGAAYGDRLDALRGVQVPCMVIAFSHDVNIPPVLNCEVADAIPGCQYVEIAGAGHAGGVTHRGEVRQHVLPFLSP